MTKVQFLSELFVAAYDFIFPHGYFCLIDTFFAFIVKLF